MLVFFGVLFTIILAGLDNTIVSTVMGLLSPALTVVVQNRLPLARLGSAEIALLSLLLGQKTTHDFGKRRAADVRLRHRR